MTKEQLRTYRAIKLESDQLAKKIEELDALLYSPRSQRLDGMPRGGSGNSTDKVDALLDKREEVLNWYRAKKQELDTTLLEIERAIEGLASRERTLLRLYYIEGLTWEQVAVEMNYSWRQIHRIHGEALAVLRGECDG